LWNLQETSGTSFTAELPHDDATIFSGSIASTTGPNSYLPNAVDLTGTIIDTGYFFPTGVKTITIAIWRNPRSGPQYSCEYLAAGGSTSLLLYKKFPSVGQMTLQSQGGSTVAQVSVPFVVDQWDHFATVTPFGAAGQFKVYRNGVLADQESVDLPARTEFGAELYWGGESTNNASYRSDSRYAELAIWDRELSAAEILEWKTGPEPINTSVPTLSENAGVLTCDPGTWDSQDNGTVTYAYQWFADDVEIVGETTDELTVSAYAGSVVTCQVTASNDGGFDPDEVTVTSGFLVSGVGTLSKTLADATLEAEAESGRKASVGVSLNDTTVDSSASASLYSLRVTLADTTLDASGRQGTLVSGEASILLAGTIAAIESEADWPEGDTAIKGRVFTTLLPAQLLANNFGRNPRKGLFAEGQMEMTIHQSNQ
jgi:hypothetical protein